MKATGIVCEYNPFHYGHVHHIEKSRELTNCDVLVAVMSGNFVQRGEPAICDKWKRTEAALRHGVDLVLELPFAYATQSAANFAFGSIATLALAGIQDLVFGSESNDLSTLQKLAELDPLAYRDLMKDGLSPAQAYEILYGAIHPNDILGIHYLQALQSYDIHAHCIQRTNSYHGTSLDTQFASATALREALNHHEDITAYSPMDFSHVTLHTLAEYYPLIQAQLLTLSPAYLQTLFLMDEGIESHLRIQADRHDDFETFLTSCTSKRYSSSRIRRTLLHLLHHTTKEEINQLPPLSHIRVLGFNATGRAYLKELRKKEDLQIAVRISQLPQPYRQMELKSAQVYGFWHQRKEEVAKELQPPIRL